MYKSIFKASCFILIMAVSASCSKKTSTPTTTAEQDAPSQQRQDRPQRPGGQRGQAPTYAELLGKMDANSDGRLSKNEIKGPLQDNFTQIDTNADGFLSEEEFNNAPRPSRGQRPGPQRN